MGMVGVAVCEAGGGGGRSDVGVGDDGTGVDVGEGGSVGPDTLISTNQG
jgi:hypothetical protein